MKKNTILRALVLLLTITVTAGFMPFCRGIPAADAATYGYYVRNAGDGVSALSDPQEGKIYNKGNPQQRIMAIDDWAGDYVYFGKYNGRPVKWRVLDTTGMNGTSSLPGNILLQSDKSLKEMAFSSQDNRNYQVSDIRVWLNEETESIFTKSERDAITASNIAAGTSRIKWVYSVPVQSDRLFLLDVTDAYNSKYGYETNTNISSWWYASIGNIKANTLVTNKPVSFWLRSYSIPTFSNQSQLQGEVPDSAGMCDASGIVMWSYTDFEEGGVVPALNLKTSEVVMTNLIGTSKTQDFGLMSDLKAGGNNWYLTLKDGSRISASMNSSSVNAGGKVTVDVKSLPGDNTKKYTQLSAMLVSPTGRVTCYGKIKDSAETGTVRISIPKDVPEDTYTLKVFAEAVNDGATSFASEPLSFTLSVKNADDSIVETPEDKDRPLTEEEIKAQEEELQAKNARIISGVMATTVKLTSKSYKGYIKLSWEKSKGYALDGYQVYRSVKKSGGYSKTAETKKTVYKNTKNLKAGTRYYYKVRGFRTVSGIKVYTKWSNVTYRKAIAK